MKNGVYYILALLLTGIGACKKTPESDSKYTHADIEYGVTKSVIRDSVKADSIEYHTGANIFFDPYYDISVGGVFINNQQLNGPYFDQYHRPQFSFAQRVSEVELHNYEVVKLKIVSPNGVTDLAYTFKTVPFYGPNVPFVLSKSAGITLPIDKSAFDGADSISFGIIGYNSHWDTTVSVNNPSVTFSSEIISPLFPFPNPFPGTFSISTKKHSYLSTNGKAYDMSNGTSVLYDIMAYP